MGLSSRTGVGSQGDRASEQMQTCWSFRWNRLTRGPTLGWELQLPRYHQKIQGSRGLELTHPSWSFRGFGLPCAADQVDILIPSCLREIFAVGSCGCRAADLSSHKAVGSQGCRILGLMHSRLNFKGTALQRGPQICSIRDVVNGVSLSRWVCRIGVQWSQGCRVTKASDLGIDATQMEVGRHPASSRSGLSEARG